MSSRIRSRNLSTRQPATTNLFARPPFLCAAISRIVLTDSCCALSMNEQVLTTIMSASSARVVSSAPARASRPIMTSLSTRFLGHPRLTKPTFCRRCGPPTSAVVTLEWIAGSFNGMESTILASGTHLLGGYLCLRRAPSKAPLKIAPVDSKVSPPCYAGPLTNKCCCHSRGGDMSWKQLWISALAVVALVSSLASAQDDKNQLSGIVGRTFISNEGIK